jgi:DNA-binding CsgD family transcriptional regulator
MTIRNVATLTRGPELSADDLSQAALRIADCRSLAALRDALFDRADSVIGVVAMGLYMYDRAERLQLISSRLAPQGFLDQYAREYAKTDTMLHCIVGERRTIDGFHFHGPAGWRRSGNYEILRGWGFYHNMGGAFVVNGRTAGALFVATAQDKDPFEEKQVKRLDFLCRAGSLALTAMRERERLRCELSNCAAADWPDLMSVDTIRTHASGRCDLDRPIDRLPVRSRAVARLLCEGQPNKAIANRLGISVYTVKEHVQNLCRRFGALNRTDLVHRLLISF